MLKFWFQTESKTKLTAETKVWYQILVLNQT